MSARRYDDMRSFVKKLVEDMSGGDELTEEEKHLFTVAYQNIIGSLRASLRWFRKNELEQKNQELANLFRTVLETEFQTTSSEILKLLQDHLIPGARTRGNTEPQVFYLKMAADHFRYLAELRPDGDGPARAREHYEEALEIGKSLSATHPVRLGAALNFSVLCYEILHDTDKACEIVRHAYDEAIAKLDVLGEDAFYKNSTLLMQLLRDNLTLWTQDSG
eukprot:TRINITY_DN610_c0_g1_i2.p1 TRINITY_DN610_c0_g1~~TRINITY_DN610_c0_g1_i2.p1  ORF type:complete len:255 (-),score=49.18 TRINITY_DN610_c0_g1_i2:303-962(-)